MKKWIMVFAAVLLVVFSLVSIVGCGGAKKQFLGLSTATAGGSYYAVGGAMAQLWSKVLQDKGINVSAQASAGSVENINRMRDGQTELALVHNKVALWAQKDEMMFKGKAYKDFSAVTALWPNILQVVVTPDIKSLEDLKGKRVVVGAVNSGNETDSRVIFEFFGLDYRDKKNVIPEYVGYNEAADALKNRRVSAAVFTGGLPTSAVMDIFASADVKLLQFSSEQINALKAKYPFYNELTIPKGTYVNQKEDVQTIAYANLLVAKNSVSPDLVYTLTKALFEHQQDLVKTHKTAAAITLKNAPVGVPIPFHPGAAKYLKEKGVLK